MNIVLMLLFDTADFLNESHIKKKLNVKQFA